MWIPDTRFIQDGQRATKNYTGYQVGKQKVNKMTGKALNQEGCHEYKRKGEKLYDAHNECGRFPEACIRNH